MASSCPTDHEAIRQVEEILKEQKKHDSSITSIIDRIDEGEGILLRSGKRLTAIKKGGGIFDWFKSDSKDVASAEHDSSKTHPTVWTGVSNKRPAEDAVEIITLRDTSTVLNGLAHVITASILASALAGAVAISAPYATAATCYLDPIIKAYLTSWGWLPTLPKLCPENNPISLSDPSSWVGALTWGMRELASKTGYIPSCSMMDATYMAAVKEITNQMNELKIVITVIASYIASGAGMYKIDTLKTLYIDIKTAIYQVLDSIVSIIKISATASKKISKSSGKFLRELLMSIKKKLKIDRSLTQTQRDILASFKDAIESKELNKETTLASSPELKRVYTKERTKSPSPTPSELMPGSMPATEEPDDDDFILGGRKRRTKKRSKAKKRSKRKNCGKSNKFRTYKRRKTQTPLNI